MTSLISGFTLATQRVEAQAIQTDTTGIDAGETEIPVSDGKLPAYYARPGERHQFPRHPGERGNLGRPRIHQGRVPTVGEGRLHGGRTRDLRPHRRSVEDDGHPADRPRGDPQEAGSGAVRDLDATLAWAAKNKGSATLLGETGFCRGGRNTWLYAAHNPNLKAAVAWYGPIKGATSQIQPKTAIDIADKLKCPLLCLYGGRTRHSGGGVQQAQEKAEKAHKTVKLVCLSGLAARIPRRLSAKLSQDRCRGRMAAHVGLVQALWTGAEARSVGAASPRGRRGGSRARSRSVRHAPRRPQRLPPGR